MSGSENIFWRNDNVRRKSWEKSNGHKAGIIWLTGLSGAGKTTIAKKTERVLFQQGFQVVLLDGDRLRNGICSDLSFTNKDRSENIRRVRHIAKLFFDQGNIVLCSFISPFRSDREDARQLFPPKAFMEVYVDCPLNICEQRDPKGLYKKVRGGEIKDFTGISSPYESPSKAELVLNTDIQTVEESTKILLKAIEDNY
jgi:adenylyl-sulfate kinase